MVRLILVRHGHVEGIHPERFRGRTNLELTSRGLAEAERLSARIATRWQPAAIFCSPLKRCVVTAGEISAACRRDIQLIDALNDIDYGSWQFRTYDKMKTQYPELYETWLSAPERMQFPKGESLRDVATRSTDALRRILSHTGDVIAVAHDSVNRVLLCQLLGLPLSAYWQFVQEPCCINEIEINDRSTRIIRLNDTCHLEGLP